MEPYQERAVMASKVATMKSDVNHVKQVVEVAKRLNQTEEVEVSFVPVVVVFAEILEDEGI